MGELARCSLDQEELLYKTFGINAELLIDHAWGWEPVTMQMIKEYHPDNHSIGTGQVLSCPYSHEQARVVAWEMAESLSLQLFDKHLLTYRLVLSVGYDASSLNRTEVAASYFGKISTDHYGRSVPAHAHGTTVLPTPTSSTSIISTAVTTLFDGLINPSLLIRRLTLTALDVKNENEVISSPPEPRQLDLFTDYTVLNARKEKEECNLKKERLLQQTLLRIKGTFGKNAILKGLNYAEGATQRLRNQQIGGHHE